MGLAGPALSAGVPHTTHSTPHTSHITNSPPPPQVCHRFQQLLPQPPSAFCLHPRTGALLIGTNQVLTGLITSLVLTGLITSLVLTAQLLYPSPQLGVLEPCRDEELNNLGDRKRDRTLSHERPLTAALYNTQFNQVSTRSTVSVLGQQCQYQINSVSTRSTVSEPGQQCMAEPL